jgi:hypothetical protein
MSKNESTRLVTFSRQGGDFLSAELFASEWRLRQSSVSRRLAGSQRAYSDPSCTRILVKGEHWLD